jgi:hypothetical protein
MSSTSAFVSASSDRSRGGSDGPEPGEGELSIALTATRLAASRTCE